MNTNRSPMEIAETILERSTCNVQVGAVLADKEGVFAWGWNGPGRDGLGEHAEAACFRRANRARLADATLYVAAKRRENGRIVPARPCTLCQPLARRVHQVMWREQEGVWGFEVFK